MIAIILEHAHTHVRAADYTPYNPAASPRIFAIDLEFRIRLFRDAARDLETR